MNTKQLSAIALSTVFSLGAAGAFAYDDAQGEDRDSAFEVLDQNNDGVIDREEARQSGITDEQFDEMDRAGDGEVTAEEFREFQAGGERHERQDHQERQEGQDHQERQEGQDQQDDW